MTAEHAVIGATDHDPRRKATGKMRGRRLNHFYPGFSDVSQGESRDGDLSQLPERLDILASAAHPQLRAACRKIAVGDEFALTPAELRPMERAIASVRRASGAARIVAKALLAELGAPPAVELPRSASRAPRWPPGFVGSLAHDGEFAVAAVAPAASILGVGIDVEPALPLPEDLLDMIATHENVSSSKAISSRRGCFSA